MQLRDKGDIDRGFFRRILREMRALGVEEIGLFHQRPHGDARARARLEDVRGTACEKCIAYSGD